MFQSIELAHRLLQMITDTTIDYLKAKVAAGVDAVQLFDSWGGLLSPDDYNIFSWPYLQQIVSALKDDIPVIVFGKGCWFALNDMAKSGASALGVDWTCSARNARYLSGGQITLQGILILAPTLSIPTPLKRSEENDRCLGKTVICQPRAWDFTEYSDWTTPKLLWKQLKNTTPKS